MKHQLRIYTINHGMLDEFAKVWRRSIYPLRIKVGFQVTGAWVNRETNQFIWILSYDGSQTWEEANNAYYASPERKALDPDPMEFIARIETYFIEDVP